MKVTTQKPTVPTPAPSQKRRIRTETASSSTSRAAETSNNTIPTSERQAKLAERGIVENFMRDQLLGSAEAGRLRSKNPAENANVIQDPRQMNLQNGADSLTGSLRDEVLNRGQSHDGWGPIGEGSMDIVVAPPAGDDRPDVLDDSFSAEDRFRQAADDRISQRSQETKDPNTQSDGDFLTFAGYAAVGVLGMFAAPAVGAAATVGAIAVGGMNYLYDAIIEDMDNDIVESGEPGPGPLGDEDVVVDDPVAGTPDAASPSEPAAAGSQNPDDPSGDNPDPGWTPNLTPRAAVDARDTVRTPANPYGTELSAEEIQARIDALGRFSPRTENAINPGDQGGRVGGDPNAPVPVNLPDEDPVGDPGSPDGTGEPSVE